MKQYWPMAVAMNCEHDPFQLFTYDSCLSINECGDVFKKWQDDYQYILLSTWIDVTDGDKRSIINHRCHVNNVGQVRKIC